jgi:uncharacterized membrane protein YkvA (DUF1232 family)
LWKTALATIVCVGASSPASPPAARLSVRAWARRLKRDIYALSLAARDPRTPWYAKLLAILIVGYAFSPIDLIPDFIPVLGYLDDVIIVPLGIYFTLRMIPPEVMAECRARAEQARPSSKPKNWLVAGAIIATWLVLAVLAVWLVWRLVA